MFLLGGKKQIAAINLSVALYCLRSSMPTVQADWELPLIHEYWTKHIGAARVENTRNLYISGRIQNRKSESNNHHQKPGWVKRMHASATKL